MLKVTSPYNFKLIKEIPLMEEQEVENALQVAHDLSTDKSKWIPAWQRIEILENVVSIMKDNIEELTNIAAEEGGKPYNHI